MEIDCRTGTYVPAVDEPKCVDCGICRAVCPSASLDLTALNLSVFGHLPKDLYVGSFRKIYVGYTTDPELRYSASSGGLATALVMKALEDGLADAALLVKMDEQRPLLPEPFLARSSEEVRQAIGSKYCPVPLGTALREALGTDEKLAVVGLPCHMWALRKAERAVEALRGRVAIRIGLFCFHTANFYGLLLVLHKLGVRPSEVAHLAFRGRGWPGEMVVRLKDGGERTLSFHDLFVLWGTWLFSPLPCLLCPDALNELADISLGDAWHLPEFTGTRSPGHSLVIVRTPAGEELLASAERDGIVRLREVGLRELYRSQGAGLRFKKRGLAARRRLLRELAREIHVKAPSPQAPSVRDWLSSTLATLTARLSSRPWALAFFSHVPHFLFGLYSSAFFTLLGKAKPNWCEALAHELGQQS